VGSLSHGVYSGTADLPDGVLQADRRRDALMKTGIPNTRLSFILLPLLITGMLCLLGCQQGGKLHVDVIIPAAVSTSGEQWTRAATDAQDHPSGDMTYKVTLPDGKTVFTTRVGWLGLESLIRQNAERKRRGWVPWEFRVEEDTIWDRIRWRYYRFAGSRAGHPEGAVGNP